MWPHGGCSGRVQSIEHNQQPPHAPSWGIRNKALPARRQGHPGLAVSPTAPVQSRALGPANPCSWEGLSLACQRVSCCLSTSHRGGFLLPLLQFPAALPDPAGLWTLEPSRTTAETAPLRLWPHPRGPAGWECALWEVLVSRQRWSPVSPIFSVPPQFPHLCSGLGEEGHGLSGRGFRAACPPTS